jgi:hypothetical protein
MYDGYPEAPPTSVDILTQLAAAHIQTNPVDPERCLLSSTPADRPMEEFFSSDTGRVIAMPLSGVDGVCHTELATLGLPVFRQIGDMGGIGLYHVPPGSRPLGSVVHLIGQDVAHFGTVMRQVGAIQGTLIAHGKGLLWSPDPSRRLLDRYAFVPGGEDEGARLILVPPYDLATDEISAFDARLRQELAVSSVEPEHVHYLVEQVRLGMEYGHGGSEPRPAAA